MTNFSFDRNSYYLSGIRQDLIIGLIVIFQFFILGSGIFGDEFSRGTNGNLDFNTFVIIYIIFSIIIGSLIFLFIFTKLEAKHIRYLYAFVLLIPYLLLGYEILALQFSPSLDRIEKIILVPILILLPIFGIRFFYIYGKGVPDLAIRNIGIIIAAGIIGRMMGIFLNLLSVIIFALVLAIFDIYSVFRGPISKIMGKPERIDIEEESKISIKMSISAIRSICKRGTPVVITRQNTVLGIGDVLFFVILLYKALMVWSWVGFVATMLAIIVGSLGTLLLLTKISPLPGLPLPVFLSMFIYSVFILINGV